MTQTIKVRAIKAIQAGNVEVYSFFLRGSDVLKISEISRIHRDRKDELKGFQRKEIQTHVNSIVSYLDNGPVIFPNALILAFQSPIEFKQSRGVSPDGAVSGTMEIPIEVNGKKVSWIVDGQQRAFALSKTINRNIMVPIVAFVAPDVRVQREQFILVNKARPLPKRLINELLPEIDAELPNDLKSNKIPSEMCNFLNKDKNSPFFGLIKRFSNDEKKSTAVITDTSIIEMIKRSNGNVGALSLYKDALDKNADIESMYKVLCVYWSAVKQVFPEAWGKKSTDSRLMHSAGIQAMGVLMDRIMPQFYNSPDIENQVVTELEKITPFCHWTSGAWPDWEMPWNEVQNTPKHIKTLSKLLVQIYYSQHKRDL